MNFIEVSSPPEIRSLFSKLFEQDLDCVYGMSDIDAVQRHFPEFYYSYPNSVRIEAHVPAKLLYTAQEGPVYQVSDKEDNRESRYLPELPFVDCTILGEWVILIELNDEAKAVAIKSPVTTNLFTNLFNYLWTVSEKYNGELSG